MTEQLDRDWHADDDALRSFADGDAGSALAASVEAHLLRCHHCRDRLSSHAPVDPLQAVWEKIQAQIQAPEPSPTERLLLRLGVPAETGRILAAVPALRGAWLLGTVACLAFAALASVYDGALGSLLFLVVAPLVPVAGTAGAYGRDADPSHELSVVTPYSGTRLVLLRTAGVLATTMPVAAVAGLLLPAPAWLAVAWLGPAVAGVAVSLALAPLLGARVAAVLVATCWFVMVLSLREQPGPIVLVDARTQLLYVAVTAAAFVVLLTRSAAFDRLGGLR